MLKSVPDFTLKKNEKSIKIQKLEFSPPVVLAPMVGISHSAFRSLVQSEGGVGLLYTEMLAARRLPHDNEFCSPLLIRDGSEKPLIYQIISADSEAILPAVQKLHQLGADGIDLNLGCPAPLHRKQGAGLMLVSDHDRLCAVLRKLRKSTALPVSVKIRLGLRVDVDALRTFCLFLEAEGVDMITIHARLDRDKFCRKPRWAIIGQIKEALSIPIVANGGIFSVSDAKKCLEVSGADGLMVGRGAVERPWLCRDIAREIYGVKQMGPHREVKEVYFQFIELLEQRFKPERRLGRLKKFTQYFAASFTFGHHLNSAIQNCASMYEARCQADDFFNQNSN